MIVVDASVAAKWLMVEPGTEAANALLSEGKRLLAPDLVAVEVAAALTRKVRMGALDAAPAARHIQQWRSWLERGVLELTPSATLLSDAAEWALRIAHPLQDCLYLALAARHDACVITADATFVRRASPALADQAVGSATSESGGYLPLSRASSPHRKI
jgi:predicted nucleic acid-binding protein